MDVEYLKRIPFSEIQELAGDIGRGENTGRLGNFLLACRDLSLGIIHTEDKQGIMRRDYEDISQRAILKMVDKLGEFRGSCKFAGWFYKIVRSQVGMRARKSGKLDSAVDLEGRVDPHTITDVYGRDSLNRPDRIIMKCEKKAILRAGINALPIEFRDVLFDHYFEGLKFSEISERTGEPKGTLQARAYNARRRLKGYFIDTLDSNV